jgi:hypothetical protein
MYVSTWFHESRKKTIGLIDGATVLSWRMTEMTFTEGFAFRRSFGNLHIMALAVSQIYALPFSIHHVDVTIVVVLMEKYV